MGDWTYRSATHDPEKLDRTKKKNGEEIRPAPEFLEELPTIGYSLPAEYMEEWVRTAEAAAAMDYNQTLDFSLSSQASAGDQYAQELPTVDVEVDVFVEVEAKESHHLRVKLQDKSLVRTEASRWQKTYVWYSETWVPCYLYISPKSGSRYWTWSLEPGKKEHQVNYVHRPTNGWMPPNTGEDK